MIGTMFRRCALASKSIWSQARFCDEEVKFGRIANILKVFQSNSQGTLICLRRHLHTTDKKFKKRRLKPGTFPTRDGPESIQPAPLEIPPGGYLLLIIPISTLCLGIWQVYRWRWKLQLIDEMEKKVHAEPVDLPLENLSEVEESLEYRKVRVEGQFDYSKEVFVGPRTLLSNSSEPYSFGGSGPTTGYHVITPFVLKEDPSLRILVSRGWIENRKVKAPGPTGVVELVGVVRRSEKRLPFMPADQSAKDSVYIYRDVGKIARMLETQPLSLDLVTINGSDPQPGMPIGSQTRVTIRNEHVNYFSTWFSLSAITSFMWYRLYILKRTLV